MSKSFCALAALLIAVASPALATDPCPAGKVKFYRNPMGTPDTSPVPKKDSMNMDYIPVCEGTAGDGPGTVKIDLDKVQKLGVRSEEVRERSLVRTVRAFANLQFDERRQYVVAPKFSGWIEKLLVNATGDVVTRGQPLFEVYSPELTTLQQEFLQSRNVQGSHAFGEIRLRNIDYPEVEIERLRRGERPPRTITVPSMIAGTVVQKTAVEGILLRQGTSCFLCG